MPWRVLRTARNRREPARTCGSRCSFAGAKLRARGRAGTRRRGCWDFADAKLLEGRAQSSDRGHLVLDSLGTESGSPSVSARFPVATQIGRSPRTVLLPSMAHGEFGSGADSGLVIEQRAAFLRRHVLEVRSEPWVGIQRPAPASWGVPQDPPTKAMPNGTRVETWAAVDRVDGSRPCATRRLAGHPNRRDQSALAK